MRFFENIPFPILILACVLLGLAPFYPEPHLFEKIRMLSQGNLHKPMDIFDLIYHAAPFIIIIFRLFRLKRKGTN